MISSFFQKTRQSLVTYVGKRKDFYQEGDANLE